MIARRYEHRPLLAIDAVSTAKALRLPRDLTGVDVLFANEDEARAMLGADSGAGAPELARALHERGAAAVVLTRGARRRRRLLGRGKRRG